MRVCTWTECYKENRETGTCSHNSLENTDIRLLGASTLVCVCVCVLWNNNKIGDLFWNLWNQTVYNKLPAIYWNLCLLKVTFLSLHRYYYRLFPTTLYTCDIGWFDSIWFDLIKCHSVDLVTNCNQKLKAIDSDKNIYLPKWI